MPDDADSIRLSPLLFKAADELRALLDRFERVLRIHGVASWRCP